MKKLAIAFAFVIASAPTLADSRSDKIGSALLGALIGAVAAQVANASPPEAAPASQPVAQPHANIGAPAAPRQQEDFIEIAKKAYDEHRDDISYTPRNACREAARRLPTLMSVNDSECVRQVEPLYNERMAENQAALERTRVERKNAMTATSDAIVARVRSGDVSAQNGCAQLSDQDIMSTCRRQAADAHMEALRSKKVAPLDCREWMTANGLDKDLGNSMTVGLRSKGASGAFTGIVKAVDGDVVSIYNSMTHDLAVINTSGSKVIEGGGRSISMESVIVGYGTQVKAVPGLRANGAATTIAVIKGACISPAPIHEVIGNLIQRGY